MPSRPAVLVVLVVLLAGAVRPGDVDAGQNGAGPRTGAVRGTAIDGSGGVLPGVTVVATSDRGEMLATTVTSDKGEYQFRDLPAGFVDVVFHLDAFADAKTRVQIQAGSVSQVVQHLELAGLAESIVVRGDPPPPPPPPPPVIIPVPPHDQASVCGPARADAAVTPPGTVLSRRSEERQGLIAAGDQVLIDGGSLNGLGVGQNLVARRRYRSKGFDSAASYTGEHTSGVLQIVAVEEHQSVGVVVYTCDEIVRGDYLAAFQPEPVRAPESYGPPAFDAAATILFADAGQMLGYARRMMVIDRGAGQGMRPGQRVTIFRRARRGNAAPSIVGDGIIVAVRADSATIRVEQSNDVVLFGDSVAPQRVGAQSN